MSDVRNAQGRCVLSSWSELRTAALSKSWLEFSHTPKSRWRTVTVTVQRIKWREKPLKLGAARLALYQIYILQLDLRETMFLWLWLEPIPEEIHHLTELSLIRHLSLCYLCVGVCGVTSSHREHSLSEALPSARDKIKKKKNLIQTAIPNVWVEVCTRICLIKAYRLLGNYTSSQLVAFT